MGSDLRSLIREVLTDPHQRRDFIASGFVFLFGLAVLYAIVFLTAGAVG